MLAGRALFSTQQRRCTSACALRLCRVGGRSPSCSALLVATRFACVTPTHRLLSRVVDPSNGCAETVTADGATPTVSVEDFLRLTPMVLLQDALQQYTMLAGTTYAKRFEAEANHVVISRQQFDQFCHASHVDDTEEALKALDEAGVVVSLDNGSRVHLRPVQYLEELAVLEALQSHGVSELAAAVSSKNVSDIALPKPFLLSQMEERIRLLEEQERAMRVKLEPAIARAARWRRSVWGGALLFAGSQLAVIARLTYFDLDWDIMEPVSYFLTIGTALFFYLYYLRYDTEHSYVEFDRRFLPRRVHKYAPREFDWKAYYALCQQLSEERAMLQNLRKWANTH